jgi:hypothetical protein
MGCGNLYFSTPTFGDTFSQSLITQLWIILRLTVVPDTVDIIDSLLRKLARFAEYTIFGLLLYRCFARKDHFRWRPRVAAW